MWLLVAVCLLLCAVVYELTLVNENLGWVQRDLERR
jgi:hypothetical protein